MVDLANYELYAGSGNPLVGAAVSLYAATIAHPNPGAVLSTTITDANGRWTFTGLAVAAYDVKITAPGVGLVKWYKGMVGIGSPGVGSITTTEILDGTIATADLAPNAVSIIRYDSTASAVIFNGTGSPSGVLAAATPLDLMANQNFTVGLATSIIQITVSVGVACRSTTGVNTNFSVYAVLDNATNIPMLSQQQQVVNVLVNMSGSGTRFFGNATALSAGTHTIRAAILGSGSSLPAEAFLRASSSQLSEFFRLTVTEWLK